jgi:hypothetical protein
MSKAAACMLLRMVERQLDHMNKLATGNMCVWPDQVYADMASMVASARRNLGDNYSTTYEK